MSLVDNVANFTFSEDGPERTQSVFTLLSRPQFEEALDQAVSEGRLNLRQTILYRRAKRNPRVLDRLYDRVVPQVPIEIYGTAAGFDFQAFLDWLVANLPAILDLIAKLLPLLLI